MAGLMLAMTAAALQGPLGALAAMTFTTTAGWRLMLDTPLYHQTHGLDCEAAALQMALGYLGVNISQDTILNEMGIDRRLPTWDSAGNMHWGDPYDAFVGNPDGSERGLTGYGTYYPTVAKVAQANGISVVQAGESIAPATLYQAIMAGRPVVAWVSFDWAHHTPAHYQAFDGDWVQWGSPYEHAVTMVGVTTDFVVVDNPWFGQQWINKSTFESSYSTFNDMAVILQSRPNDPGVRTTASTYQGATPVPSDTFHGVTPARIVDTRSGIGGVPVRPLGPGGTMTVQVSGQGGIPATGVSSVVLNLTATDTTAPSYLRIFPAGTAMPGTSNLNWRAGETVPNLVVTPVSVDGKVTIYNNDGAADVLVDAEGWNGTLASAPTAGLFNALSPTRILDTRNGTGGVRGAIGTNATISFTVAGRGGVPSSGIGAVAINVTVTQPTAPSHLTVFPSGSARPATSNLNYVAGKTMANRVIVQPGAGGAVSVYNYGGSVQVIADVVGWFTDGSVTTTGSHFVSVPPQRVLDTRLGFSWVPPGATGTLQVADTSAIGVTAVVMNVTATGTTGASYLELWPNGGAKPGTSDLNWVPGQLVANLAIAKLGANGAIDFYNYTGAVDLVVDVVGYYGPSG